VIWYTCAIQTGGSRGWKKGRGHGKQKPIMGTGGLTPSRIQG